MRNIATYHPYYLFAFFACLLFITCPPALAQQESVPVEIEADNGIEWFQEEKKYVATGNAFARKGAFKVKGDILTVFYKIDSNEEQKIYRIEVAGNVYVEDRQAQIWGSGGVYHLEKKIAVIVGDNIKMHTGDIVLRALDSLEYWEGKNIAVARGNATIVQTGQTLKADVITAKIENNQETNTRHIRTADAIGNVIVETTSEIITGDKGRYDVDNKASLICGNVNITREQNHLTGNCAQVDMVTGNSSIHAEKGKRVKGLILKGAN